MYNHIISLENLLEAWKEFLKGKRSKKDVQEFQYKLSDNIFALHTDLKNKTYVHGGYYAFNISDPKPRNIHKASVRDRLLHHALYRKLYPLFDIHFIHDSYSCRKFRGTHRALKCFRKFALKASKNNTKTLWILKCDIKKFFASVDQKILGEILKKYITDPDVIDLIKRVTDSFSSTATGKGLPLGNLTSQLLVNVYMNEFDQFMKHDLKAEYYVRYADDFVIMSRDKAWLQEILTKIGDFLDQKLALRLHPNKISIRTFASGVDFLGWVHFPDHRVLRTTTKRRMFKRLKMSEGKPEAINSYLGLISYGNTKKLKNQIDLITSAIIPTMKMKTIKDISHLAGVKVLLRVDFNAPIKNGAVVDDTRIKAAIPTIDYLKSKGAVVILISHLESAEHTNPTLEPVARKLTQLGVEVNFIKNYKDAYVLVENSVSGSEDHSNNRCFLLENLRFFEGEKANDPKFAKELASLADIYVNDAFPVCHRKHASIVGVPKYLPSYAGFQLEKEVANLSQAFNPSHPFLFILGGAKFETKMPLVEKFAKIADSVFICGALANDFIKAQGHEVGKSLTSDSGIDLSGLIKNPKISSFIDVAMAGDGVKDIADIAPEDMIADAGKKTIAALAVKIASASFILWNGPFGIYEKGFTWGTTECARLIAANPSATKIVGGGDTLAAISSLGVEEKFTFVSTGGGAMLDYLAEGSLPGIQALGD